MKKLLFTFVLAFLLSGCGAREDRWSFVSMPDFLNVDCYYPQPGWEDALSYILQSVKAEDPAFLSVAGDLVMGHWDGLGNDRDTIAKYSEIFYTAWKNRMDAFGLKYYVSVGDHDVGDDAWLTQRRLEAVRLYKEAFVHYFQMPENGPEHMKGTAYWWKHKNVLFISVDVFEESKDYFQVLRPGVTGKQLEWLEQVLATEGRDADHIIVQGHTPVLQPVNMWSSSGLKVIGGEQSPFWQVMKKYGVDLYLCGEVHAVTCREQDGIMQVAHGSLIGYNNRANYLKVTVSGKKLELEIKEIDIIPSGDFLWQTQDNRPLERVDIPAEAAERGFLPIGRAVLDKSDGDRKWTERKGCFLKKYEKGDQKAFPVFSKSAVREIRRISIDEEP